MLTTNDNIKKSKWSIVGIFVNKTRVLALLEALRFKYKVRYNNIHIYKIDNNLKEYLVTIKTYDKDKIIGETKGCVYHVKHGCLFSINGLNKFIDIKKNNNDDESLNSEYDIEWEKHRNKLIVTRDEELSISNIEKIEDWSSFFKV